MKHWTILMTLIIVGVIAGCGGGGGGSNGGGTIYGTANLTIGLPSANGRGIADIAKISIKVMDGDKVLMTDAFDYTVGQTISRTLQVATGTRVFVVDALRANNQVEFTGKSSPVLIKLNETTQVTIELLPPITDVNIDVNIHEVTGPPKIVYTYVPPYGAWGDPLKAQVSNIIPSIVKTITYIKVGSGWWVKPYWNTPFTPVGTDGSVVISVTTGGIDEQATEFRTWIVTLDYTNDGHTLPPDPPTNQVLAMTSVTRSP